MFKRSFTLTLVILAGALSACDAPVSSMADAEMDTAATVAEAARPSVASKSANGTSVYRSTVVSFLYSPCLGDLIKLEGEVQIVLRSGESSGNGGYHEIDRITYILQGLGLISGDRYEIREVVGYNHENSRLPFGSTVTNAMQFRIIKPGSGLVFSVRAMEHLTVNANGEITVELDEFAGACSP